MHPPEPRVCFSPDEARRRGGDGRDDEGQRGVEQGQRPAEHGHDDQPDVRHLAVVGATALSSYTQNRLLHNIVVLLL